MPTAEFENSIDVPLRSTENNISLKVFKLQKYKKNIKQFHFRI